MDTILKKISSSQMPFEDARRNDLNAKSRKKIYNTIKDGMVELKKYKIRQEKKSAKVDC